MLAQVVEHAFRVQPHGRPALDLRQSFLAVGRPFALHTGPVFERIRQGVFGALDCRPVLEGLVTEIGDRVVDWVDQIDGDRVVGRREGVRGGVRILIILVN